LSSTCFQNPFAAGRGTLVSIEVDFSHRLAEPCTNELFSLSDNIGLMTERAQGILHLLFSYFNEGGGGQVSNAFLCGSIDVVIQEIEDIKSLVRAYDDIEHNKSKV
jgi:hypothetical protein